jgi:hypothetical protein
MRRLAVILFAPALCLMFAATAAAQEGHPVKGSWIGTWDYGGQPGRLLIVMDWDGEGIVGAINPGREGMPIAQGRLEIGEDSSADLPVLIVHLAAQRNGEPGEAVDITFEGEIRGLAFPNRQLVGTWSTSRERGTFEIARQ